MLQEAGLRDYNCGRASQGLKCDTEASCAHKVANVPQYYPPEIWTLCIGRTDLVQLCAWKGDKQQAQHD